MFLKRNLKIMETPFHVTVLNEMKYYSQKIYVMDTE